jgi:type VI secretion system secreted protein Hcp
MAIYLKYGTINGDVTTDGFSKWIELNSFQWGVGRGIGTAARGAVNREGSEPSISEVVVTKVMDSASNNLFVDAVAGTMNSKATIKFTTTTKGKVETFLTYDLTDTGLSGYSLSSGGDKPQESLSLNFTAVSITYGVVSPDGKTKPDTVSYDLTQMKSG